jgi:hypothetical protein
LSDTETRARNAAALKDNPFLAEVIEQVRAQAVIAWLQTPAQDGERARELAWVTHKVVDRIESVIQGAIDDGVIAAARVTAPLR